MVETRKQHVVAAAEARCNLIVFYGVISLLEGGAITGHRAQADAERVIKICKTAAARQLTIYDQHVDAASQEASHATGRDLASRTGAAP